MVDWWLSSPFAAFARLPPARRHTHTHTHTNTHTVSLTHTHTHSLSLFLSLSLSLSLFLSLTHSLCLSVLWLLIRISRSNPLFPPFFFLPTRTPLPSYPHPAPSLARKTPPHTSHTHRHNSTSLGKIMIFRLMTSFSSTNYYNVRPHDLPTHDIV